MLLANDRSDPSIIIIQKVLSRTRHKGLPTKKISYRCADNSGYVEKQTRNLTPQPPKLVGKGENSKPLSLLETGFPDKSEKSGV